jgi:hypothetical protein
MSDEGRQIAELKEELAAFEGGTLIDTGTARLEWDAENGRLDLVGIGGNTVDLRLTEDDVPDAYVRLRSATGLRVNYDFGIITITTTDGLRRIFTADEAHGIATSVHNAPADGALQTGEMSIWFDQTNGASKLKIKAKQADGAVKTGEVALA